VNLLLTGIGRDNARRTFLAQLEQLTPARVFTCGFAGGLNPAPTVGDVLFTTSDPDLTAKLLTANASLGKFFCAPRIATTAQEKSNLRQATSADAVEMESEVIQDLCRERKIPCATVRVISDAANEDLPLDFNQLSKSDLSLDYGKLAWAIARSPGKLPALLRLQKNTGLAAERLAAVLAQVIGLR